jgi:hypothetical protein
VWLSYTLGISASMMHLAPLLKLNYAIHIAFVRALAGTRARIRVYITNTVARAVGDNVVEKLFDAVGEVRRKLVMWLASASHHRAYDRNERDLFLRTPYPLYRRPAR